jgi:hypothetical protein
LERDVIQLDAARGVEMRFTDVQTIPQPIQQQSRGIPVPSKGKVKPPKKGKSTQQEMGIV